jgi:DNA-binding LacI/PurR family transcriptional regulator
MGKSAKMDNASFLDGLRRHRARAADVAELAGVSESAVSRTFRGGSVSAHVRARVQIAARQLGYRPNAMASTVITRRSNVIAILMASRTNSHLPEVLSNLAHAAEASGVKVMLFTIDNLAAVSEAIDQILSYQVDAAISLAAVQETDARLLADNGVGLVLYNFSAARFSANLVSCDHHASGASLARHLLTLGHRDFAIVRGPEWSILAADRARGVLDALGEAGIASDAVPMTAGDFGYDSGRAGAKAILARDQNVTALVCINDLMAIGAIDEATSQGLRVPDDLSVAGFDGAQAGRWDRYQLTTMEQPLPQLAAAAMDVIKRNLADPCLAHETRLLSCKLVQGKSAGPAPDRLRGTLLAQASA